MTNENQALKLVELSICSNVEVVAEEPPIERETVTSTGVDIWPDQEIWYPDVPPTGLRWIAMKESAGPDDQPYQACIFGGDRGQDLQLLSGITIRYMDGIRSIAFCFGLHAEKTVQLVQNGLPKSSVNYVSFAMEIDGNGGERIVGIETLRYKNSNVIEVIKGIRVSFTRK